MVTQKREEINWLRGFAAFLVVLGHSIIVFPVNLHEIPWCKWLYDTIYAFHMPLFFAISGYCFSMRGGYCAYLIKKAKRLLVPYCVFAFGGLIPRLLLPALINGSEPLGTSIVNIIFHGGEYWFLYTLFIIFAIFPAVIKAYEKNSWVTMVMIVGLGALSNLVPDYFCLPSVLYYTVPFTMGYLGKKKNVFSSKCVIGRIGTGRFRRIIVGVISCVVYLVCGYLHGKYNVAGLNLLEAILCIVVCYVISLLFPPVLSRFGKYSDYSLPLYLLNGYFLVVSRMVIVNMIKVSNPIIIIVGNMIFDFYVSYLLIRFALSKIPVVRSMIGIR